MDNIEIKEVNSTSDLKKFTNLSFELYKNDKAWVPPLKNDYIKYISGKDNALTIAGPHIKIIAKLDDYIVGRLIVGINNTLNLAKELKDGYISQFECIQNYNVCKKMLDYATDWLKKHDINRIKGPLSLPDGEDNRGFLIDNFDDLTSVMNIFNKNYYNDYFVKYGFEKYLDCYAYNININDIDQNLIEKYTNIINYAKKKYGFRIDSIDLKNNKEKEIHDVKNIMDKAMPKEWEDFTTPTIEEVHLVAKQLEGIYDKDLVFIARNNLNEPIGVSFALPDYNQLLKKVNGSLFPFGIFKYLYYKNSIDRVRIFVLFIIPEYRNKAVSSSIILQTLINAKNKGYTWIEGSTIWEYNTPMINEIEKHGYKRGKTYRIYVKKI